MSDLNKQETLEGIEFGSGTGREVGLRGRAAGPGAPQLGVSYVAVCQQRASMGDEGSPSC